MSWGIAETASELEKLKSESADYLNGLNSCGEIDYSTYSHAFDFYADLIEKAYKFGKDTDVARERYEDLCEYFNNNPHTIEIILNDRKEFKAWLERLHWHVLECDKLARKLEALEGKDTNVSSIDTISRQAAIDLTMQYCPDDDGTCSKADEDIRNLLDELEDLPSVQPDAIPLDWIQKYADDWEDMSYAYENPIQGMLDDWRGKQE